MKRDHPLIAIAPDSFKGALDAAGVAAAIAAGLKRALPAARFRLIPMADGGEGTVDAWTAATRSTRVRARVRDPLGRAITAGYAQDQGREVFAIPGRIGDVMSTGPNGMIARGEAKPVFSTPNSIN